MDGSWLQLKLKRRWLQQRLHAHLTLLHVYYPWNQIKSILLLNIRITKHTNPNPNPNRILLLNIRITKQTNPNPLAALPCRADVFEPQP